MLEKNPLGIHYLKFLAVSTMITIHGFSWLMQASGDIIIPRGSEDYIFLLGILFTLFSQIIPVTAGITLRLQQEPFINAHRLTKSKPIKNIINTAIFLIFIEIIIYFQSSLSVLNSILSWNVLHLIGISFIFIAFISRICIWALIPVVIACYFLSGSFQKEATSFLHQIDLFSIQLIFGTLFAAILAYFLFLYWKPQNKFSSYFIRIINYICALYLCLLSLSTKIQTYEVEIKSFLVGSIFSSSNYIFWPIVPGLGLVCFGFLIGHFLIKEKSISFLLWCVSISLVGFTFTFREYISFTFENLQPNKFWYYGNYSNPYFYINAIFLSSVLIFIFNIIDKLSGNILKISFFKIFSTNILWIYIMSIIVMPYFPLLFLKIPADFYIQLSLYSFSFHIIFYYLGHFLESLGNLKLVINFSKNK